MQTLLIFNTETRLLKFLQLHYPYWRFPLFEYYQLLFFSDFNVTLKLLVKVWVIPKYCFHFKVSWKCVPTIEVCHHCQIHNWKKRLEILVFFASKSCNFSGRQFFFLQPQITGLIVLRGTFRQKWSIIQILFFCSKYYFRMSSNRKHR